MSIKLMSAIWEAGPLDQGERFVLLALADNANDAGECWPSVRLLSQKTCMAERSVRRVLKRLCAGGWLVVDTGGGRKHCNLYHIKTLTLGQADPRSLNPDPRSLNTDLGSLNPDPRSAEPSRTVMNHHKPSESRARDEGDTENGRTIRSGDAEDTATPGQPGSISEADENGMDAGTGEDKPKADDPPKPKPKRKRSATAKCGLDGNWEPDTGAIAYAEERGLDWQRTWEDFREYNIKHGKQWAGAKGWLAAWQGWCRRQNEFDAKQNSRNSRHGGQSRAGVAGQGDRENDPWHEALLARRAAGVGQFGEAIPVAGNGQPDDDGSEILFFGDYRSLGGS